MELCLATIQYLDEMRRCTGNFVEVADEDEALVESLLELLHVDLCAGLLVSADKVPLVHEHLSVQFA